MASKKLQCLVRIVVLILFIVGMVACGGAEEAAAPAEEAAPAEAAAAEEAAVETTELSAEEIKENMVAAIDNLETVAFEGQFQIATSDGAVRSTFTFQANMPDFRRIEFESENDLLNGVVLGSNDYQGWVYSPLENALFISQVSVGEVHLGSNMELARVFQALRDIEDRGFDDTQATNLGIEEVNGHETYQLEIIYDETAEEQYNLSDITTIYSVDTETFLPHQLQVTVETEEVSAQGIFIVQDEITQGGEPFEEQQFSPVWPEDAQMVDIDLFGVLEEALLDGENTSEQNPDAIEGNIEVTEE